MKLRDALRERRVRVIGPDGRGAGAYGGEGGGGRPKAPNPQAPSSRETPISNHQTGNSDACERLNTLKYACERLAVGVFWRDGAVAGVATLCAMRGKVLRKLCGKMRLCAAKSVRAGLCENEARAGAGVAFWPSYDPDWMFLELFLRADFESGGRPAYARICAVMPAYLRNKFQARKHLKLQRNQIRSSKPEANSLQFAWRGGQFGNPTSEAKADGNRKMDAESVPKPANRPPLPAKVRLVRLCPPFLWRTWERGRPPVGGMASGLPVLAVFFGKMHYHRFRPAWGKGLGVLRAGRLRWAK